jgi:hypothetical protein
MKSLRNVYKTGFPESVIASAEAMAKYDARIQGCMGDCFVPRNDGHNEDSPAGTLLNTTGTEAMHKTTALSIFSVLKQIESSI